jgi:hypothetical protein
MQVKTIRKTIKAKMDNWLSSITDEQLVKSLKRDLIVTGGSITSLFLNEKVNDYDVYIRTRETLMTLVQYYTGHIHKDLVIILNGEKKQEYINEYNEKSISTIEHQNAYTIALENLKEDQIKLFFNSQPGYNADIKDEDKEAGKYLVAYLSPNAISLTDNLQIVIRFWGDPDKIHETYDFIHATNYFTYRDGLVTNVKALESILTKQLFYKGSLYPVTSIIRVKKFVARNWKINAGEMLKMIFQASKLDLTNPVILEEQLIGVDVAYFARLIHILRNIKSNITDDIIIDLIDKVFNEDDEMED